MGNSAITAISNAKLLHLLNNPFAKPTIDSLLHIYPISTDAGPARYLNLAARRRRLKSHRDGKGVAELFTLLVLSELCLHSFLTNFKACRKPQRHVEVLRPSTNND